MQETALSMRVDSLENYMKDLSYQALRTERELAQLGAEMRAFKEEMRAFKDEMRTFKEEMRGFKDEMKTFKEESERDRKAMNRKWGELANKMGTLVEDMVAPNLPRVARELFGCGEPEHSAVRLKRRAGGRMREVDALVVCRDVVLVNETKSSLVARDVDDLASHLKDFTEFFPEYSDRRCVGIIASLWVEESIVRYATIKGVLAMGMGEETMQVLNPEAQVAS